eukprot:c24811_g1_i1 orf=738-1577(-)
MILAKLISRRNSLANTGLRTFVPNVPLTDFRNLLPTAILAARSQNACAWVFFGNGRRTLGTRSFTHSRIRGRSDGSIDPAAALMPAVGRRRIGIARFYLHMLDKRPVLTKSITAGTIYTVADITSQGITMTQADKTEITHWDVARTFRMAVAGLFMSGPTLHLWFNFVSKILPKRDVMSTVKKMILGQTLYGPSFTIIFFSLNAFAQGERQTEIVARLRRDFFPTIRSGLMYWPVCDFITYRHVPVHLQPLVSNSFSYIWTVYLTYMASLKKVATDPVS